MNEYQVVGKGRTVLPAIQYALYTLGPMIALYALATVPPHILGTRIKQIISFPLMACLVAMPYLYRDENDGKSSKVCLFTIVLLISCAYRHVLCALSSTTVCRVSTVNRHLLDSSFPL